MTDEHPGGSTVSIAPAGTTGPAGPAGPMTAPRVVPDLLRRSARLVPDRAAIVCDGSPALTFAQLEGRSNAFARGLRARGVGRGDHVGLLFPNTAWTDFAVAYFGTLKAGAAALLLGERFTDDDLAHLARRFRIAGVVTGAGRTAPGLGCWVEPATAIGAGMSTAETTVDATPADPADVIFTSGTTSRPRGVVAPHANVVRAQAAWPTGRRLNQPCLNPLPIGSVASQVTLVNCIGGQHTLVAMAEFAVADFARLVAEHAVTTVCLVPTMGHWLVRAAGGIRALPGVRGVSFSGAALPVAIMPELAALFPRAAFFNFLTSTEAFPARVATQYDPARPHAIGRPVGASAIRITGEDGAVLGPGEVGAVWLRSADAPPRRFLDDDGPDATPDGAATIRGGWTRTGDLGHVDADGYLFLAGRTSDVVIVGGFNVSTHRVEQALCRHPEVVEAAAFGTDHPVLGEVVVALVVLRPDAGATVRDVRRAAAGALSRRELPAVVRIVTDLPRNDGGKVPKRDLPALLDAPGESAFTAPRTPLESAVAEVWAQVLDLGAVGVDDDFFDVGGDSLAATEIAARLRARLGAEVDAVTVFELPTVAELAEHVVANAGQHAPTERTGP
jgi:acyl-CoA synthetase (AMP-forming)/AMP-acid ligase II/acyl carrier protein